VDPKGDDQQTGSKEKPWKTLDHAVKQLHPGDVLCLRGGTYYESVALRISGTAEKPITIRSFPGELAIIDAGLREFFEAPGTAWEPYPQGAEGEYRSVKSYPAGGGFGNFGDSMIPFHRYMSFADLRSTNEFWKPELENRADDPGGIYCGPGARRDPETGRIHIRLSHTELAGLGDLAYMGETDPRKLPLVIAGADYAVALEKAAHLRLQDLVVRGAKTGALKIENAEDIELEGVTLYAGSMGMRISGTRGLRLVDCALRGHGAPWHSRFAHKNRAGSGYLILAEGACTDFDFSRSEFTDHHDFFAFHNVENMRFHQNIVDNFNDDGFEPGPKRERGQVFIYENLISRCLSPFTAHAKKPTPVASEPGSGVYIYRNLIDLRRGTYSTPPEKADPTGAYLERPSVAIAHDHGSPIHPVYYVYQNTFLMQAGVFRDYYAFSFGAHTNGTTRRVFNNIFAQAEPLRDFNFTGLSANDDFQSDGNLFWGLGDASKPAGDLWAKLRSSPLLAASKQHYAPGWAAADLHADPRFVRFDADARQPADVRLQKDSPAIDAGVAIPAEWPDPLRASDPGKPDLGALPAGAEMFEVGRIPRR
ncbi:MAG TPA: hypothetical protein VGO11_11305, partial [Chthoniobacteraceae bacterium]|nr:hypothetical protein [Chthoniobacteraceae bacterium]